MNNYKTQLALAIFTRGGILLELEVLGKQSETVCEQAYADLILRLDEVNKEIKELAEKVQKSNDDCEFLYW